GRGLLRDSAMQNTKFQSSSSCLLKRSSHGLRLALPSYPSYSPIMYQRDGTKGARSGHSVPSSELSVSRSPVRFIIASSRAHLPTHSSAQCWDFISRLCSST